MQIGNPKNWIRAPCWCGDKANQIAGCLHFIGFQTLISAENVVITRVKFFIAVMAILPLSRKSEGQGRSMKNSEIRKKLTNHMPDALFIDSLRKKSHRLHTV